MRATCEGEEAARAMVTAQVDEWMRATTTSADSTKAQGFVVDNTLLQARSPGLGYRVLPQLDAKAPEKAHAPWGSTVQGALINQDWVQVDQQFLPTKLNNVQVLRFASAVEGNSKVAVAEEAAAAEARAEGGKKAAEEATGTESPEQETSTIPGPKAGEAESSSSSFQ